MQAVQFTFKWVQGLVFMQILGILIPNNAPINVNPVGGGGGSAGTGWGFDKF